MALNNLNNLPVYKKAMDLYAISREIASYVTYNKDVLLLCKSISHRDHIANSLLTDAFLISKQIARAESSKSYSDRMTSATFIQIITQNIISYCRGLEMDGVKEKEYLHLLQNEVKIFRKSFKFWRASL